MKSILNIVFVFLCFNYSGYSQINDKFSDELINLNVWSDETNRFIVNSYNQLKLNSEGTDTSYISCESSLFDNVHFSFWLKQSFNSSTNNYSKIYLASDNGNLKGHLNGYYLKIGGSDDKVSFWKQNGNESEHIITFDSVSTGNSTNELSFSIIRKYPGNWYFFITDIKENIAYKYEVVDSTFQTSQYFGISCKYTSSNATKFYYDDIVIESYVEDLTKPKIQYVSILDDKHLKVSFNESIDTEYVKALENYTINANEVIDVLVSDENMIVLELKECLTDSSEYSLLLKDILDGSLNSNKINDTTISFSYYMPKQFSVVINEFMTDPTPKVYLPESEYIELYNNSNYDINIKDWTLNGIKLPEKLIKAKSYLLLTEDNSFSKILDDDVYIISDIPTITNSEGTLVLRDNNCNKIHFVSYDLSYYNDDYKSEGGWSLEMIDFENPCGGKNNWHASKNLNGGTPGEVNSVKEQNPDIENPKLLRIGVINDSTIKVHFNESIDTTTIKYYESYNIIPNIGKIESEIFNNTNTSLRVTFSEKLTENITYTLNLNNDVCDCVGNKIEKKVSDFALPSMLKSEDVLINEILFNPNDNQEDFVEVYNNTNTIFDLKELLIGTINDENEVEPIYDISTESYLLFPGDYVVLTSNKEVIAEYYNIYNEEFILELEKFPPYNNDEGTVIITNKNKEEIDKVYYNEDMHFPLLVDKEGVSLERISFNESGLEIDNWHSASEDMGWATPCYKNSQFKSEGDKNEAISVSPEIFSPNNDGYNDILSIDYEFENEGNTCSVKIFDKNGILIKDLVNNKTISTSGSVFWDGRNDANQISSVGIYIIYTEVFLLNGKVKTYKNSCVLGTDL